MSTSVDDSSPSIIDDPSLLPSNSEDDIDSLPDSAAGSTIDSDSELGESDADREWKESLQQLELLLTMVVVPYLGKYVGRKCAYWGESYCEVITICKLTFLRLGEVHGVEIPR
jgi:hypothetical protein